MWFGSSAVAQRAEGPELSFQHWGHQNKTQDNKKNYWYGTENYVMSMVKKKYQSWVDSKYSF